MNDFLDATGYKPLATHSLEVLMVTGIFPPDIGGPATYVPTMARELVKRGHKLTVVTLSDRLDHDDRSYNFPVHRIRRGLSKPLRFLFTVLRILREGQSAQVLYVNGLFFEAVIANFILRKPMVQKIVGDWAWERATNKGWVTDTFEEFQKRSYGVRVELLKALRRFYAHRASKIIVPSDYFARWVKRWDGLENKITVVHNSVELLDGIEKALLPLQTPVKVVTVGRLIPLKRIDLLMNAVSRLETIGLVIVGDGPERQQLEEHARSLHISDRVYFAGQTTKAEALSLMAACDIFVLNSTHESFSHVIIEAMSVGVPVVATSAGALSELIRDGKNGVLIPLEANGQLSESLRRLIDSPKERERLSYEGQETAKAYGSEVMVGKTEHILSACVC